MFCDIFVRLCQSRGISPNAAAKIAGVKSSGTVSAWKKGALPRDGVLASLADYFGVTTDFLLGLTADSYMLGTQYRLEQAEKSYRSESDPDRQAELALEIETLRESLEDQKIASMLRSSGTETDFGRAAFFSEDFPNLTEEEKNGLWKEAQDYARYRASLLRKGGKDKDGRN